MKRAVLVFVLLMGSAAAAHAQFLDTGAGAQTGVTSYGSYFSGGIDTIGLYNGNVVIQLPIFSRPGREIPAGMTLAYNSQKWQSPGEYDSPAYGTYVGGWQTGGVVGGYIWPYDVLTECVSSTGTWKLSAVWVDGSGARHRYVLDPEDEEATVGGDCYTPPNDTLLAKNGDGSTYDTATLTVTLRNFTRITDYSNLIAMITPNGNTRASTDLGGLNRTVTLSGETWTVPGVGGSSTSYTLDYSTVSAHDPYYSRTVNLSLLTTLTLPNSQTYSFEYNHSQGFLTKITLPNGGYVRYVYYGCTSSTCTNNNPNDDYVIKRIVSADGTSGAEKIWLYARTAEDIYFNRTVAVTSPDGTIVEHDMTSGGVETEARYKANDSGHTLVQTVQTAWDTDFPLRTDVTTIMGSLSRLTHFDYDGDHRIVQQDDSDWYTGTVVPLTRTTTVYKTLAHDMPVVDYVTAAVWNGSSYSVQSKTQYGYDDFSLMSRIGSIPDRDTPAADRGNVTTVRHFTDASNYVDEQFYYDELGNMVEHVDPRGKQTTIDYTDNYSDSTNRHTFALPTSATNALSQTVYTQYDYSTGLPVEATGLRASGETSGPVTTTTYDALLRPTEIATQLSSTLIGKTTYTYTDGSHTVAEAAYVESGKTVTTTTTVDGLGRPLSAVLTDPGGNVTVTTEYDDNGRAYRVSQPYRSGTPGYSETAFDALGRPVSVTNSSAGTTVSFAYTANSVTATDEAGVQKKQTFDGVGRLTAVAVPDPSQTTPSLSNPLTTTYGYGPSDVSGYSGMSQFTVTQHVESTSPAAQIRKYVRDWAGQLVYESHPETGITKYDYDDAGNLVERLDPRIVTGATHVTTTYAYDDVNRLLTTTYNDGTPTVTRTYDTLSSTKYTGLLTTVTVGASNSDVTTYTYNTAGQVASENRSFYGISGTFSSSYTYDVGGRMLTATYPSGRVVTYSYQNTSGDASDRINTIVDTTTSKTLVSSVVDNASGLITSRTLGTTTATKVDQAYNGRNQLTDIVATQNTGATTLLDLEYAYGGSSGATANVGRIRSRTDSVEPEQSVAYTYDAMYRLKQVSRTNTSTPTWSIAWTFDQWGNRTAQTASGLSEIASQTIGYNGANKNSDFDYDDAGNVTNDDVLNYQWDAESRLKSVNSGSITYAYDGEGRRVKKTSGGVTTYYMYGITGLQSEFSTVSGATGATSTDRLTFRVPEHNGTGVLLLDSAGNPVENNRVLPYGEPFRAVSGSTNDDKFTTYNRDSDTGLDYAMARHYASKYGAFMSPDPGHVGANPSDPRTWNAYLYTSDDPINFIDPWGLEQIAPICDSNGENCVFRVETAERAKRGWLRGLFGGGEGGGGGGLEAVNPCYDINTGKVNPECAGAIDDVDIQIAGMGGAVDQHTTTDAKFCRDAVFKDAYGSAASAVPMFSLFSFVDDFSETSFLWGEGVGSKIGLAYGILQGAQWAAKQGAVLETQAYKAAANRGSRRAARSLMNESTEMLSAASKLKGGVGASMKVLGAAGLGATIGFTLVDGAARVACYGWHR